MIALGFVCARLLRQDAAGGRGGDVAVFGRFCRRRGGCVRDCGGETERGNQPENSGEGIAHVRWSATRAIWFKETVSESTPPHVAGTPP